MPRRAKIIPTAGEKPSLNDFENQTKVNGSYVAQKFLNGPASFWDLCSSYLAQSSYLVRNMYLVQSACLRRVTDVLKSLE